MRAVVQRVHRASVRVDREVVGTIDRGLCVLLGVTTADTAEDARALCHKITALRIFDDDTGRMNRSVVDVDGALLIVSQFTLYADCRSGHRPSFGAAAPAEQACVLYECFVETASDGPVPVATGRFRARMSVELVNDGPVTLILDTAALR